GNPRTILGWLQGSSTREGVVVDPPKPPARREIRIVHRPDLPELARDAAKVAKGQKSLFFCQSRATTEAVAERMRAAGTDVFVHHSAVSLEERDLAEARFHRGTDACIVCTSTLELGIDVGDLDRVFQTDAPGTVSSFLQRMGRTGRRAGQAANTTFFCQDAWTVAQALALVGLAREGWVERVEVDDRCWPVLVHQLIAMSLAYGTIRPDDAWALLSRVPDFHGITRAEFDTLIEHLVSGDYLYRSEGRLALGDEAERAYGRKNFLQLYAVFSSPQSYTVVTTGDREVGYLNQDFVDRLVEDMSSFLLAGRAWLVHHVDHANRHVRVTPAPRGVKPSWCGYVPMFLDFAVCRRIRDVLTSDQVPGILHASAAEALKGLRDDLGVLLGDAGDDVFTHDDHIQWWTFAGGRINTTLKYALHGLGTWKIVADNFSLRIEATHLHHDDWNHARQRLRSADFWADDAFWDDLRAKLPAYRLSKFQRAMPDAIQREVLAKYLLDVERASVFCMGGGGRVH
ncbi:MAG: DEAD/DEAH box helicase, partial [Myxococcales bacterium]|nr:DEAD/DEAH box helicase [Myxococcales bacterium]